MPYNWDKKIEIRDLRNGNWFWVNKNVWQDKNLNASDKCVYGTLAYFANNQTQECYPSLINISDFSGISKQTVVTSIRNLLKNKYILKEKTKGKVNIYTLVKNFDYPTSQKEDRVLVKNKTTNNTNINNTNIILHSDVNVAEVQEIFNIIYKVNPSLNFGNKTSRKAAEWLIRKYGFEKTKRIAEYAVSIFGKKYAPSITTPYLLKEKLSNLAAFKNKEKSGGYVKL